MKKLTLAIPTFNRPSELIRLLTIIEKELENSNLSDIVEVLVFDNSENDIAKDKLASSRFALKPWLTYEKNEGNIGFDGNVLKLFERSSAEFVWLVGDDDIIFEGSIGKVIALTELEPDILHIPFKQPQNLEKPQYQLTPRIKYWTTLDSAVEQILKYIKITSFVLRRKNIVVDDTLLLKDFSRSGWMHLILGFEILSQSPTIKTVTLSEFLAGSLDTEWKTIAWAPSAFIAAEQLTLHRISKRREAFKEIKRFGDNMYLGGIHLTLLITAGVLYTSLPLKSYEDFGARYPFRKTLLLRPGGMLKYVIMKLRLGKSFALFIRSYETIKEQLGLKK